MVIGDTGKQSQASMDLMVLACEWDILAVLSCFL